MMHIIVAVLICQTVVAVVDVLPAKSAFEVFKPHVKTPINFIYNPASKSSYVDPQQNPFRNLTEQDLSFPNHIESRDQTDYGLTSQNLNEKIALSLLKQKHKSKFRKLTQKIQNICSQYIPSKEVKSPEKSSVLIASFELIIYLCNYLNTYSGTRLGLSENVSQDEKSIAMYERTRPIVGLQTVAQKISINGTNIIEGIKKLYDPGSSEGKSHSSRRFSYKERNEKKNVINITIPDEPDRPNRTDKSDIPDGSDTPEYSDIPNKPEIPDITDIPDSTDRPDIPDRTDIPDRPEKKCGCKVVNWSNNLRSKLYNLPSNGRSHQCLTQQ